MTSEDSPSEEEEDVEVNSIREDSLEEDSAEAEPADSKPLRRKRSPVAGFFRFVFGTVFYLLVMLAGFCAGVAWHYIDLTSDFDVTRVADQNLGALVFDRRGERIGRIGNEDRKLIRRSDLPPHFVDALVAAEDQRFFLHPGVDPVGSLRAAWVNYRKSGIAEGGSTVTQQLARNVFRLEDRHIERKLTEMAVALRIERSYNKEEILEFYLNRIYFGSGFYGVGAAAEGYFGREVNELTVGESAMLCGLIRSPSRLSPFANRELAVAARDRTLRRMAETGSLTESQLQSELAAPPPEREEPERRILRGQRSAILEQVALEVRRRAPEVPLDGAAIHTSIDFALQVKAAQQLEKQLLAIEAQGKLAEGADGLQGAIVILSSHTGELLASVGSRDFLASEFDRANEMKRPPGSAFLPFLYASAYESGKATPETLLFDAPLDNRLVMLGGTKGLLGEWSTENPANRWEGEIPAREALRQRKNAASARLGFRLGLEPLSNHCREWGIDSPLWDRAGAYLGASEMSLSELTRAFLIFSEAKTSEGREPGIVKRIEGSHGASLFREEAGSAPPKRTLSTTTRASIRSSLREANEDPDRTVCGISGTTAGFTDAWHFGFDDHHTWGIWIGRDTFTQLFPLALGGELARPIAETLFQLPPDQPGGTVEGRRPRRSLHSLMNPKSTPPKPVPGAPSPLLGKDPYGSLSLR